MGLGIIVGILPDLNVADEEGAEHVREYFRGVNEVLVAHGLPAHAEPERLPPLDCRCGVLGFPYSFLHYLRRAYAHRVLDPTWVAAPLPDGERASTDPVIDEVSLDMTSHLLCHSDAEGFYLPIDFADVLFDETERVPGGMIGSSYRVRDELTVVAPALGIELSNGALSDDVAEAINRDVENQSGIWIERLVWLALYEAARLSIEHRSAICFT